MLSIMKLCSLLTYLCFYVFGHVYPSNWNSQTGIGIRMWSEYSKNASKEMVILLGAINAASRRLPISLYSKKSNHLLYVIKVDAMKL